MPQLIQTNVLLSLRNMTLGSFYSAPTRTRDSKFSVRFVFKISPMFETFIVVMYQSARLHEKSVSGPPICGHPLQRTHLLKGDDSREQT